MLYSIVKACLGAASQEMAHSNMALHLCCSLYVLRSGAYEIHLVCTQRLKTKLTGTLQSDTQSRRGETGCKRSPFFSEQQRILTFYPLLGAHVKYLLRQQYCHAAVYVYCKLLQCEPHKAQGYDM